MTFIDHQKIAECEAMGNEEWVRKQLENLRKFEEASHEAWQDAGDIVIQEYVYVP